MEFFDIVGGFGRWQLRIFLFLLYVNIVGMWQNFSIVFQTPNMKFRCIQPSSEQLYSNSSAVVFDNRCEVLQEENSSILVPCTEWEYDTSSTSDTIVSEWDLVCSREWLISLVKSMYMVGFLLSVLIFGQISDLVGRFPTIIICYCITCVSMFLSLLSNSFSMFITLRFFQAFGRAGITTTGYVLIREIVGSEHQTVMGLAIQVGWSIGFVTLVGVAWFFRNWFWLQLVIALSFIPIVFAFGIISESPRWLLTRGKTKKLEKLLTKAAAINGRKVKDEEIEGFKLLNNKHENEKHSATLLEVLRMPRMRNRLLIMIYVWFVNVSLYYAFSYNISDLAGNMYLNFFIAGLVEFPCYVMVFWGIKWWGRRPILVSLMLMGGLSCAAILPIPADMPWLSTTLGLVGKFFVSGSFRLLYLYTAEIFPTGVRNVTLGSCSMCARIGSILAPFIRDLGKATHPAVPNALYAFLALTSGLLALLLPETRGLDLPDTLLEGENLGVITSGSGKDSTDAEVVPLKG
ncbi:organic cation transporter protein [Trichonephila inaurata madagascariensis]|uniref:Organic cation transporter protein n=1 Tax=Trichonephila inaurata madagascariensis TaxID=2747483 RepID=A0A8X6XRV2_9ARAC|nr:organic cation transporter protein [Trichonephila inaurata madagascariensis]